MLQLDRIEVTLDAFHLAADWCVNSGERLSVLGPSGGGKSTLLALIAGFMAPQRGRVLWNGADLAPLPPGRRPVTMLFQAHNLFPNLTIGQNLALGLAEKRRPTFADRDRIAAALGRVGLPGMENRRPGQLSGGEQSRAALARALLRSRPLLLLDEPFAALGPGLRLDMLDLVGEIAGETGATVIMVTHDISDARHLGGRSIFVSDGVAQAPQQIADLLSNPPKALQAYLGRSLQT